MKRQLRVQIVLLAALGVGFAISTVPLLQAEDPSVSPPRAMPSTPASRPTRSVGHVLRESSILLDRVGVVRRANGRFVFDSADGKLALTVLENRMLERVDRLLSSTSTAPRLLVTGMVTEYRNHNYLLLKRFHVSFPNRTTRR